MSVLSMSPFKMCSPPVELLDYPLFFPKPNFRGRPDPAAQRVQDYDDATAEALATQQQEEAATAAAAAAAAPKPDVQKQKFQEVSGGQSAISPQTAGDLSRSMGFAPSQADLRELHAKYGDKVTFDQFTEWQRTYCVPHKAKDNVEELTSVFAAFDPAGSGTVSRAQVQTLLEHYGEGLTPQEVDTLLSTLGYTGDRIPYGQFVDALLAD